MDLAKPRVDIGLATGRIDALLRFWQEEVGATFDHVLPIARGLVQHRHDVNGSVLKLNTHRDGVPDGEPSPYRQLLIAREGLTEVQDLADPDGNRVALVPPGHFGVSQIGIRLAVRDVDAHRRFYADALGLAEEPCAGGAAFRAGETLLLLDHDPDAPADAPFRARGWRYITFQVRRVDHVHAGVLAAGGREAMPPTTLGETARISMVLDPDGGWIELSQRASIVGSLDASP